jgi:thiosulfate dehydrogenase
MSRMGSFILGMVAALVLLAVGGYLFVTGGGFSMETSASPLPLEKTIARMALDASMANAADKKDPLPLNDYNLLAGASEYKQKCAFCHGTPGHPSTAMAQAMFPIPPQLFEEREMVTDDPQGVIYWIVTHGIRLSGMPGFAKMLSDTERWQVTMLVTHADKLPSSVRDALGH